MEVTIKFDTNKADEDEKSSVRRFLNADDAYCALYEIGNEVFRPARKHGYADVKIQELCRKIDNAFPNESPAETLIGLLEERFREILVDKGIDLSRDWS